MIQRRSGPFLDVTHPGVPDYGSAPFRFSAGQVVQDEQLLAELQALEAAVASELARLAAEEGAQQEGGGEGEGNTSTPAFSREA